MLFPAEHGGRNVEMVYLMQITSYQANLVYSRNSQLKRGCVLVTFLSEQDDKG